MSTSGAFRGGAGQSVAGWAEGVPLFGYGHSFLVQQSGWSLRKYYDRLMSRLGVAVSVNNGIAGDLLPDTAVYAHGTTLRTSERGVNVAGTWTPSVLNRGLVIIDGPRNDAGWGNLSPVKALAGLTNGLDALVRLIRAGSALQDTNAAFVYTGTWTSQAQTFYSGANAHFTTTPGDKVTITTPVGTDFDLILMGVDTSFTGASFTVTVDAVDITAALAAAGYPTTTAGQFYQAHINGGAPVIPMAVPLRGLSNIAHTVVVAHTGGAGNILFVCRLLTPSPNPPTVVMVKAAKVLAAGYAGYAGAGASSVVDDTFNAQVDAVAARFGVTDRSIIVYDPNVNGWDPTTMIALLDGSQLHPNDRGSKVGFADPLGTLLGGLPRRNGLVML